MKILNRTYRVNRIRMLLLIIKFRHIENKKLWMLTQSMIQIDQILTLKIQ